MADAPAVTPPPNRTGKVAAVIAAVVLLVGLIALTAAIVAVRDNSPVKIDNVSESIDDTEGCQWVLEIDLLNDSDEPLTVDRITVILNRGRQGGTLEEAPSIEPGQIGRHLVRFRLPPSDGCPSPDEINHGNLIFRLDDGTDESIRF